MDKVRLATKLLSKAEREVQPLALLTCPEMMYAQRNSLALEVVIEPLADLFEPARDSTLSTGAAAFTPLSSVT